MLDEVQTRFACGLYFWDASVSTCWREAGFAIELRCGRCWWGDGCVCECVYVYVLLGKGGIYLIKSFNFNIMSISYSAKFNGITNVSIVLIKQKY